MAKERVMAESYTSRFDHSTSDAYDRFMGRYSRELAVPVCDQIDLKAPMTALDVGCGTGALTAEMIRRLGTNAVSACDPSPIFVEGVTERY
ncbi:MAG: methyltransferase domain-containing protein, partial [Thermomicrobiales bacterium]